MIPRIFFRGRRSHKQNQANRLSEDISGLITRAAYSFNGKTTSIALAFFPAAYLNKKVR